ncbi:MULTISPECIES: site-specific DNA-methyltransferase [unclassified Mesorhizobium]|uniref:DNA-methyltransferase n=1 Tax=unclassified Mesorhizobium TaxID=325217 RepID=UPI00112CA7BC|nr:MULTISPECIES: site-specific DNA-methyltransferase [unclassified Mesorhizobium]TPJ86936.1 site-specific DNA-methyltransferase [Mesorhizobium sp. B2-5-12]TPK19159.1 site-specific DNA-methyltransferase [Mesorhizobium sp. B2-5-6]
MTTELAPTQVFLDGKVELRPGDCRDVIKAMPDNSIDSVVCDPPYALVSIVKRFGGPNAAPSNDGDVYSRASAGFMGRTWDTGETAFAETFWAEVLRVLKPGGHVVAFSGTRTYHRMAVAIEDAGFEIRDQLAWCYGSGFPKSHDVSKAIDKHFGAVREKERHTNVRNPKATGGGKDGTEGATRPWIEAAMARGYHEKDGDEAATPQAAEWQGWGTALKPAWEPICLARKPLIGTVAANVLERGTGALNIDGCRVGTEGGTAKGRSADKSTTDSVGWYLNAKAGTPIDAGRWPANIVHDGSDEVVACFPDAPGQQRAVGPQHGAKASVNTYGDYGPRDDFQPRLDQGSAARFFYTAKADKLDRIGSKHPTVKPVDLMQWLVRLVTPPDGVVLDPFAGSGSTGEAAWREGMRCILIEREEEYQTDVAARLSLADKGPTTRKARAIKQAANDNDLPLFGAAA